MAKKEAKHHYKEDAFTKITRKLEFFLIKNLKMILISVTVATIIVALYFTINYVISKKEDKANIALGKVYLTYKDIINDKNLKKDELNKKLLNLNENFSVIIKEFPKSKATLKSYYFIANTLYETGNYQEAIENYKNGYSLNPKFYIASYCLMGEAICYEQLEEYSKAEEIYKDVIKRYKHDFIVPTAIFNLAQIYEKEGKYEKSEEEYSIMKSDFGWSSWNELSEQRLILIKNFM